MQNIVLTYHPIYWYGPRIKSLLFNFFVQLLDLKVQMQVFSSYLPQGNVNKQLCENIREVR